MQHQNLTLLPCSLAEATEASRGVREASRAEVNYADSSFEDRIGQQQQQQENYGLGRARSENTSPASPAGPAGPAAAAAAAARTRPSPMGRNSALPTHATHATQPQIHIMRPAGTCPSPCTPSRLGGEDLSHCGSAPHLEGGAASHFGQDDIQSK
jgi:hypothetical protein